MIILKYILKKGCGTQSSDSEQRKMAGCIEDVDIPTQAGGISWAAAEVSVLAHSCSLVRLSKDV